MYNIKYYSNKYIACKCGRIVLQERYKNHCYSMLHSDYLFNNNIKNKLDLRDK